jgi:hypothetical protein
MEHANKKADAAQHWDLVLRRVGLLDDQPLATGGLLFV